MVILVNVKLPPVAANREHFKGEEGRREKCMLENVSVIRAMLNMEETESID